MWKWSVITDEISQDIARAAAFAAAFGLQGLEIRSVFGRDPYHLTDADVRTIRERAQDAELTVCAVAPPFFKCNLEDQAAIRAHLDGLSRTVEIANMLGAGIVRAFGFWRAEDAQETPYARIAEQLRKAIPILEDGNVRMGLENDPSVYTPDGESLAALIREVGHPRIGATWDPGNVAYNGGSEAPYPDGYDALRGHIVHIHLKDARRTEAVAFGEGDVDYQGQFSALRKDKYDGWVSLETHYRLDRALSERELLLPAGMAFSEGGEHSGADFLMHMAKKLGEWGLDALYSLPGGNMGG